MADPINREERVVALNRLLNDSRGDGGISTRVAADRLADWYVETVRLGGDPIVRNSVLVANEADLRRQFIDILNTYGRTETEYTTIPTRFQQAFISYWTGATLGIAIPPPPSVQIVTHVVTVPGVVTPFTFRPTGEQRSFAEEFVDMVLQHLSTVQGLITALVPSPPGAPVPTPFPWVGYL